MLSFVLLTLCVLCPTVLGFPLQQLLQRQTTAVPSRFMFIFGDSYSATGFSTSVQPQPSVGNKLGNPPLPGLRLSGGDIWVDVVMKNYTRAGTVAYDFAVSANAVNSSRVQNPNPAPTPVGDLRDQLAGFEASIGAASTSKLKWKSTNSLFVNWFGINDISIQCVHGRNRSTAEAILGPDITDYFGRMERMWQLGARNFVTVLVPPIWRIGLFGFGNATNAADVQYLTQYWNTQVRSANSAFQKLHPYTTIRIVDPTATFNTILDNPTAYGAPNASCWDLGVGQPCLWADFAHPGIVISNAVGRQMGGVIKGLGF